MDFDKGIGTGVIAGLPKLYGKKNYAEWRFIIDLVIKREKLENKKRKSTVEEFDLKLQTIIGVNVSPQLLCLLTDCTTYMEMLDKLATLYADRVEDLEELHNRFQNFQYDQKETMQENVCRLQNLRAKIERLGDPISDTAVRSKILNSLPRKFNGFVAASQLVKGSELPELLEALFAEDQRLRRSNTTEPTTSQNRPNSLYCLLCKKSGHSARFCSNKSKVGEKESANNSVLKDNSSKAEKTSSESCAYCKERSHHIRACPKLEARKNATCFTCSKPGHFSKNCPEKASNLNTPANTKKDFTACVAFQSRSFAVSDNMNPNSWILDNACTTHISNNKNNFFELESVNADLLTADNSKVSINLCGKIKAQHRDSNLLFTTVLYNPESPANLISFISLLRNGWIVSEFTINRIVLCKQESELVAELDDNELWVVKIDVIQDDISHLSNSNSSPVFACLSLSDWHRKFAHQNAQYTRELLRQKNIKFTDEKDFQCLDCLKGKATVKPFPTSTYTAKEFGELTHADLMISPVRSIGNNKYALCIKDDFSKYRTVYLMKTKSNTVELFADYFNKVETQTGNKPRLLRTDNGTEEINSEIIELCSARGIEHELTCPWTSQQNGRIERDMRTLSEAVGTILIQTGLGKEMWAEILNYVVYTLNRVSKSRIPGKAPIEFYSPREDFGVEHLLPFGIRVTAQIPKNKRKKFDAKAREGIFIGYPENTKGYKIWFPETRDIDVSRNVEIVRDNEKNLVPQQNDYVADDRYSSDDSVEEIEQELDWTDGESENERDTQVVLFSQKVPEKFQDLQSMSIEDQELWMAAIKKELESMQKYEVWEVVNNNNYKLIDTKWVFRYKDSEYGQIAKARLTVRGCFSTNHGPTYAPVASIISIRIAFAVAVQLGMKITYVDVETAFLNGTLKEAIYLKPPKGVNVEKGKILKLKKAMYGLKQAPRSWNEKIDAVLTEANFKRSKHEYCLYVKSPELFIIMYVDDLLIVAAKESDTNYALEVLRKHFSVKVSPTVDSFLGINVKRDESRIVLNQTKFIEQSVAKFGVQNAKPISTPMEMKLHLSESNSKQTKNKIKPFQKLLGTLNYIMERSRPDINYCVNKLSRYTSDANDELYQYLLRILKYLRTSKDLCLTYERNEDASPLEAYSDASWGTDEERKSTSGYLIRVFGNVIQYKSKKQSIVALSTAESEFIALSECSREVVWIKGILQDLGIRVGDVKIFEDNQSCIKIAENRSNYTRTKHVDLKYHYVKDLVLKNIVKLEYVDSKHQIADGLTKALSGEKFRFFVTSLNLR